MFNTPENRTKFVEKFGYKHNRLPYEVDAATANKVLDFFDRYQEEPQTPKILWSFIMQDRKSYMLGQRYMFDKEGNSTRISNEKYEKIGEKVVAEITEFVKSL